MYIPLGSLFNNKNVATQNFNMAAIFQDGRQNANFCHEKRIHEEIPVILGRFQLYMVCRNHMFYYPIAYLLLKSNMAANFLDGRQKAIFCHKKRDNQ